MKEKEIVEKLKAHGSRWFIIARLELEEMKQETKHLIVFSICSSVFLGAILTFFWILGEALW